MSKKLLTDDLILSKMAEDYGTIPPEDIDTEDLITWNPNDK